MDLIDLTTLDDDDQDDDQDSSNPANDNGAAGSSLLVPQPAVTTSIKKTSTRSHLHHAIDQKNHPKQAFPDVEYIDLLDSDSDSDNDDPDSDNKDKNGSQNERQRQQRQQQPASRKRQHSSLATPSTVAASAMQQQNPLAPNDFEFVVCICKELEQLLETHLLSKRSESSESHPRNSKTNKKKSRTKKNKKRTLGNRIEQVQKQKLLSAYPIAYLKRLKDLRNDLVHGTKNGLSEGERFEFREGYELVKKEILQNSRQVSWSSRS